MRKRPRKNDLSDNLTASIGRLDSICNLLHQIVVVGEDKKWPEDLLRAATKLANDVTNLAGAIDSADGNAAHVQGLAAEAQLSLPSDFAAFGQALADDLTNSLS
jgi:ABC-type transporter Mla subunit MlaD